MTVRKFTHSIIYDYMYIVTVSGQKKKCLGVHKYNFLLHKVTFYWKWPWNLGNPIIWGAYRASENIFWLQCKRGSSKWASPHHKQFATFLRNFYIFKQLLGNFEIWASVRRTRRTLFSDALGAYFINSLGPSDAIWRWRSWSTLVQVMACLFPDGTKPLPEPMLTYHQ